MKLFIICILCLGGLVLGGLSAGLRAAEEETGTGSLIIDFDKVIAGPADLREGVVPEGRVTLPYAEMRRLWLAVQEKGVKPEEAVSPIDAVVASAEYDLQLEEEFSVITADYRVEVFTDDWRIIPLVGGALSLEQSDAGEGSIVRRDGAYALMVKGRGEYAVQLILRAAGSESWSQHQGLKLRPAAATLSRLRVSGLSDQQSLRLQGGDEKRAIISMQTAVGTEFLLNGDEQELNLVLESAAMAEQSAALANAPVVESVWEIQSQVFVRYAEGRLHYATRVFAQSDAGSGLSMELILPRKVAAVVVEGEDVVSWRMGRSEQGLRKLHITWRTRDQLDRRFRLSYEVAQSPLSEKWMILPPALEGEDRVARHLMAIEVVEGLEWKGEGISATVASRRLPQWLGEQVKQVEFVTAESSGELQIEAKWLPVLETVQATVSQATFSTRLVKDGAMLVEAEYHVQQSGALDWTVDIPSLDQVLRCEVDGQAVKPVRRSENELEFHLKAPTSGDRGDGTVVRFSYALQSSAFDPVSGQVVVELPQTDLFIHRLDWDLEIPQAYETTAIEGNVQLAPVKVDRKKKEPVVKRHLIRLHKELCRGERPSVEVYYRRRGIDD
ncbi:MAG: hypothetical protein QM496_07825 [Verrucomicrobiota bacterium]